MENQSKVLIVDDELVVRETLDALLGDTYQLYFAEGGVEGLAMAIQTQPDVILLDVMMPQADGFEVCRQIRATPVLAEIPIILITALDDRNSRLRGLREGADDYISKPFDSLELAARVKTITRLNRYRRIVEQRGQLEQAHQDLLNSYDLTIEGWVKALDLRDKETEGHSQRVTKITLEFAQAVGVGQEQLADIRRGALLHDVGKLGIPDSILLKAGKLTDAEWEVMRKHPVYANDWLTPINYLRPALDIPYCHHEKWDGSGYPRQLCGEAIPLPARLFAIVDVWDALRSDRPYRAAMPEKVVLDYLKNEAGRHFDPALVDRFISMRLAAQKS
jgi:putative two-component system response regulator